MYRWLVFGLLVFSAIHPAFSENGVEACQRALSQSENQIDFVQEKFKLLNSFKSDFEQISYSAALDMSETSSGNLKLLKPDNMYWEYFLPEKQIVLVKGLKYELYQPKLNQIISSNLKEVLLTDFPLAFMFGKVKLTDSFSVKDSCETKDGIKFVLVPKTSHNGSQIREMILVVDRKEYLPIYISILDTGDNRNSVYFSNSSVNSNIPESAFKLSVNRESVDIINSPIN